MDERIRWIPMEEREGRKERRKKKRREEANPKGTTKESLPSLSPPS